MKNIKKIFAALLSLALILSLAACGATPETPAQTQNAEPSETEAPAPVETQTPEESAQPKVLDTELPVRVMTLNGTTGFGMASLMTDAEEGKASLNYVFSVETDASNVTTALASGECDIAALPTNAASALYNKTEGKVQVLALNTLGVLYLVSDGKDTIESFTDLDGKTVYVPAQNPSFIFSYLCQKNGVSVEIDNSFAQPAELNAAVTSGQVSLAVLPEPLLTVARSQNSELVVALDLTEEWDKVSTPGSLVQGCVVVRSAFAAEHPAELARFLEEYEASVALLSDDVTAAVQKIEATGLFAKAAVAEKAIPRCNLCFISGEDMKAQLSAFLEIMFETAPQSIGGKLPGDDFYCILK